MKNASDICIFFLVLASIVAIIGSWTGRLAWLPIPVLFLGAIAAYLALKKFPLEQKTSAPALGLFVFMAVLCAYPLLFVHPFFPASSDAVQVTNIRILQDNIPPTYAPYSSLAFTYQAGFALFSSAISKLLFFVPDYISVWLLGVVFSALIILLVYWIARHVSGSENAGLAAAALVIGSKFVFQNFYYGDMPMVMGLALFFAAMLAHEKKSPLAFVFFPATLIVHPFMGVMLALFFGLRVLLNSNLKSLAPLAISAIAALPSFATTYLTVFGKASAQSFAFNFPILLNGLQSTPLWLGILPLVFFVLAAAFSPRSKLEFTIFLFSVLLYAGFLVFSSIGLEHADKFFVLFSALAVIYAGTFFASKKWERIETRAGNKKIFAAALAAILLFSLAGFALSADLTKARSGSKAGVREENFALKFKEFDPSLSKVAFLSKSGGWLALLSNKIPLDVRSNHFVPDSQIQAGAGWQEVLGNEALEKQIESGCSQCAIDSGVKYVVVDTTQHAVTFDFVKVFEYDGFVVYAPLN